MRPADHLTCCELHPEEHHCLQRIFRNDAQVAVHHRSGWEALRALLPPKQKRGLVLIDPPFEEQNEFANLAQALLRGYQRFAHGIFAAWYPIKQLSAVRGFIADVQSSPIRDAIAIELYLRQPLDPSRLNGCGLLVINAPFQFEDQARAIVNALVDTLAATAPDAGTAVYRIAAA